MINAQDVKARLLGRIEELCHYLFPEGSVINSEFRVGDITGRKSRHGKGGSLAVALKGSAAGLWHDYGDAGAKGDVYDLWCMHFSTTFRDAFPEICRWAGVNTIERPQPRVKPARPTTDGMGAMTGTPALAYLTETRGLNIETLKAYRIRSHARPSQHNTDFVAFQFWDSAGDFVMLKSTGTRPTSEGKKDTWSTPPYYTLWGWWLVKPSDRCIIITEGEYDAMSVHQMNPGIPVLSLPAGVSNLTWIENDYDALIRFERIYICTDGDAAGEKCAQEIAKRLGLARCFRIKPPAPFKDANEFLTKDDTGTGIDAWFAAAANYDPPTLRTCRSLLGDLQKDLAAKQAKGNRNDFLWPSVPFEFRDGETTIISGLPGHGKSDFLYQSHFHEMMSGRVVCIASFEIPAKDMLKKLIWHFLGQEAETHDQQIRAAEWLDSRVVWLCPKDDTSWKELLLDFEYAAARFGASRFVVDSLHFMVGKEDYAAQDLTVRKICEFDTLRNTHTAIVCHSLKAGGKDKNAIPGMAEVEGSGGITKPISNGITIWRNTAKGEALEEDPTDAKALALHDGVFKIWKQRATGEWPMRKLWFHKRTKTFTLSPAPPPPPAAMVSFSQPIDPEVF